VVVSRRRPIGLSGADPPLDPARPGRLSAATVVHLTAAELHKPFGVRARPAIGYSRRCLTLSLALRRSELAISVPAVTVLRRRRRRRWRSILVQLEIFVSSYKSWRDNVIGSVCSAFNQFSRVYSRSRKIFETQFSNFCLSFGIVLASRVDLCFSRTERKPWITPHVSCVHNAQGRAGLCLYMLYYHRTMQIYMHIRAYMFITKSSIVSLVLFTTVSAMPKALGRPPDDVQPLNNVINSKF